MAVVGTGQAAFAAKATGFDNLYRSTRYIAQRRIPGDFVECGVFLGGAAILAALARDLLGLHDRNVYLYDTSCGFSEGDSDFIKSRGKVAHGGAIADFLDDVKDNIRHCNVMPGSYEVIAGPVEKTLLAGPVPRANQSAACGYGFLRHLQGPVQILYPKLVQHGVLIIDDYGTWDGVRHASDEALAGEPLMPHRISHSIRSAINSLNAHWRRAPSAIHRQVTRSCRRDHAQA